MKLHEIQQQLKAPKSQFNSFGKYNYRSCEDILNALKPLMGNSTLTITDEIQMVGNRFYIKATAKFFDGDTSTEVSAYAREQEERKGMDESQVTGSASSYARKYALNGLFMIDDTKDADHETTGTDKKKTTSKKDTPPEKTMSDDETISDQQRKMLFAIVGKKKFPNELMKKIIGVFDYKSSNDIKKSDFKLIKEYIENNSIEDAESDLDILRKIASERKEKNV